MLYGVHVYARSKVVPDLMLARGEEAYRAARLLGDQAIEFQAAGGVALCHLDLGDIAEAERWLGLATAVANDAPTPTRARQLETWRGMVRAAAGDAAGMRLHLEKAVEIATGQGRAAGRCDSLARLAIESARLGAATNDEELLQLAARSAIAAKELVALLPGHPIWGPRADAALATVALARGDVPAAVAAAGSAMQKLQESRHEDMNLDVLVPVARAMLAGGPPEVQGFITGFVRVTLSRIAQGTLDEAMRVRWLRGPRGREIVGLAGTFEPAHAPEAPGAATAPGAAAPPTVLDAAGLDEADRRLMRLLTEGYTNAEIAEKVGATRDAVGVQLAKLLARLGVSNRAEATTLAFKGFLR